jgi:thiol:disulfide interchange protein DsbD
LNWDIAKGYYLYKKKIKMVSDHSQRLGEAQFPAAKIKDDEFFGKVGIYHEKFVVIKIIFWMYFPTSTQSIGINCAH